MAEGAGQPATNAVPASTTLASRPRWRAGWPRSTRKRDHHPERSNVHDRVDILLTTHDALDPSMRDIEPARFIDTAHERFAPGR